ncbi:hypothetical protein D1816_18685 [Aquimarina sp. AD10]|uniref:Uncharacterized protein n=1 Tax=Aquimarina aggregata TaxID=1642818 RepID=A0A162ZRX6_9FLAO|nr:MULTISPECIES: hypothetical protein [Aquimarina]AXT62302.1 hypothetical protein D1816_18685 [Aquimarina sp. AD10]KZS39985.1 hypothetical protein AWE51_10115 [Aquimarina aggregata]RKM90503.1 hypothetical protein D7033_23695 [Aquimarina sp. AD10]
MTLYAKINADFSQNYIGYSALAIIASTCLGSIAIMTTLLNGNDPLQMFMVFLSVVVCSAHNAAILTVQKPKLVLDLLIISIVVNTMLLIGNGLF